MNVIVIMTDSLRADHCSAYDGKGGIKTCRYVGKKVHTPNFDKLATDGTLFTHAYSGSLPTIPNRTDLWTGRIAFPFRKWQQFKHEDYLLSEVLWNKGYTSALITDTYHMHKPIYNCGRGFDMVNFIRGQEYDPWIVKDIPVDLSRWYKLRGDESDKLYKKRFKQYLKNRSTFKEEKDWFTPQVINSSIRWLKHQVEIEKRNDKLFLWIDNFDPHEPWDPPEPFRSMYKNPDYNGLDIIYPVPGKVKGYLSREELERVRSLYAGEVSFIDKWIGIFLDTLKDLGIYENSLIIWISDHGEPFGEHGIIRKARPWNYEELVRIPWIIRYPDFGKEKINTAIVQPIDIMPTILDLLEISTPLELKFLTPRKIKLHGKSLLPLMQGEVKKVRDYAYSGHYNKQWSVQNHRWRLLLTLRSKKRKLYYRPHDPYDQKNVIGGHKDIANELELKLRRQVSKWKIT